MWDTKVKHSCANSISATLYNFVHTHENGANMFETITLLLLCSRYNYIIVSKLKQWKNIPKWTWDAYENLNKL